MDTASKGTGTWPELVSCPVAQMGVCGAATTEKVAPGSAACASVHGQARRAHGRRASQPSLVSWREMHSAL